ncbi:MAG: hypothetical protein KJ804_09190 [Proteobacteria bacterium]|nr:hypothetical protein [Pseudomonadota bacterium]MBU1058474.1 hypothetical protein [Pseudomonadota bacterium]
MQDLKKTSFFKKIFGQKSSCCSLEIEEIEESDSKKGESSENKNDRLSCCCSTPNHDEKTNEDQIK